MVALHNDQDFGKNLKKNKQTSLNSTIVCMYIYSATLFIIYSQIVTFFNSDAFENIYLFHI